MHTHLNKTFLTCLFLFISLNGYANSIRKNILENHPSCAKELTSDIKLVQGALIPSIEAIPFLLYLQRELVLADKGNTLPDAMAFMGFSKHATETIMNGLKTNSDFWNQTWQIAGGYNPVIFKGECDDPKIPEIIQVATRMQQIDKTKIEKLTDDQKKALEEEMKRLVGDYPRLAVQLHALGGKVRGLYAFDELLTLWEKHNGCELFVSADFLEFHKKVSEHILAIVKSHFKGVLSGRAIALKIHLLDKTVTSRLDSYFQNESECNQAAYDYLVADATQNPLDKKIKKWDNAVSVAENILTKIPQIGSSVSLVAGIIHEVASISTQAYYMKTITSEMALAFSEMGGDQSELHELANKQLMNGKTMITDVLNEIILYAQNGQSSSPETTNPLPDLPNPPNGPRGENNGPRDNAGGGNHPNLPDLPRSRD